MEAQAILLMPNPKQPRYCSEIPEPSSNQWLIGSNLQIALTADLTCRFQARRALVVGPHALAIASPKSPIHPKDHLPGKLLTREW
jgi:hypothetical protein